LRTARVRLPRAEARTRGYYTDHEGHDTLVPCLALLPHGRFLAGYTMGEGMITNFEEEIYTDEREAWLAAHQMASQHAETERELADVLNDDEICDVLGYPPGTPLTPDDRLAFDLLEQRALGGGV
jgi:hypothetical protein